MASQSKISNMCAIKWSKMNNKSHGASNTSSTIRNIHAQERCHLEGVSLCILHNAEVVGNVVWKRVVVEYMRLALKSSNGQLTWSGSRHNVQVSYACTQQNKECMRMVAKHIIHHDGSREVHEEYDATMAIFMALGIWWKEVRQACFTRNMSKSPSICENGMGAI